MKDIKMYIDVIFHSFEVGLVSFSENLFPIRNFYPAWGLSLVNLCIGNVK
jgi:hypothetical protein